MKTPGQRIKEERKARGWSQQRLADEIKKITKEKISRAAVAYWELGDSKTQKPQNFFGAAQALGVNPYWLLNESKDKFASFEPVLEQPIADYQIGADDQLKRLVEIYYGLSPADKTKLASIAETFAATENDEKNSRQRRFGDRHLDPLRKSRINKINNS